MENGFSIGERKALAMHSQMSPSRSLFYLSSFFDNGSDLELYRCPPPTPEKNSDLSSSDQMSSSPSSSEGQSNGTASSASTMHQSYSSLFKSFPREESIPNVMSKNPFPTYQPQNRNDSFASACFNKFPISSVDLPVFPDNGMKFPPTMNGANKMENGCDSGHGQNNVRSPTVFPQQPLPPYASVPFSHQSITWNPWQSKDFLSETANPNQPFGPESHHQPSPMKEEPVRNVFEFPQQLSNGTESPAERSPFLRVITNQVANHVNTMVHFMIQCFDSPPGIELHTGMVEVVVESPLGNTISPVQIKKYDSFLIQSFTGSFKANEEAGDYTLRIRMIIPMKIWPGFTKRRMDREQICSAGSGVITKVAEIPVSRNYFRDSQNDCLLIQCQYKSDREEKCLNDMMLVSCVSSSTSPDSTSSSASDAQPSTPLVRNRRASQRDPNPCKLWGLCCDMSKNNLYFTDRTSHEIVCVTPEDKEVLRFGRSSHLNERLMRPTGIACDNVHNRLVVSDKDNHRICFFTLDGKFISAFGGPGYNNGMFNYPWDVAVSPNGQHIVVADSRNHRIQVFDRLGNFLGKFSVYESNPFEYKSHLDYPRGITFDQTGNLIYATDFNGQNIIQLPIDLTGYRKVVPDGRLRRPQGIAVDAIGNVLVVDSRNNCLRHVTPKGDHIVSIHQIVRHELDFPVNVTIMAGGFVALLDGHGEIRIF